MHDSEQYLYEALQAGASGYVLKSVVDRDLVEACRATMRGEPFLYPGGGQRSDPRLPASAPATARRSTRIRSPRASCEIVKLIAESYSSKQIAETLVISEKTVERHRSNIFDKLGHAATASS